MSSLPYMPLYPYNDDLLNSTNSTVPMWKKNETQREYYDIEVFSNVINAEWKDFDDILNTNKYKCHICNIDVPRAYSKEHVKSVKHGTYLKIANIALDRTNSYMKSDTLEQQLRVKVDGTYFCDPCAAIVQNTDDNHVLSKKHVNSVKKDELVHKLLEIYESSDVNDEFIDTSDFFKDNKHLTQHELDVFKPVANSIKINEELNEGFIKKPTEYAPKRVAQNSKETGHHSDISNEEKTQLTDDDKGNADVKINAVVKKPNKGEGIKKSKVKINFASKKQNKMDEGKENSNDKINVAVREPNKRRRVQKNKKANKNTGNSQTVDKIDELSGNWIEFFEFLDTTTDDRPKTYDTDIYSNETIMNFNRFYGYIANDTGNAVKAVSGETVEMISQKGDKLRISFEHFNGTRHVGNELYCLICVCFITNTGQHNRTEDHLVHLKKPINDSHFYRQVSSTWNYCIVCNKPFLITGTEDHICDTYHVANLQKYELP